MRACRGRRVGRLPLFPFRFKSRRHRWAVEIVAMTSESSGSCGGSRAVGHVSPRSLDLQCVLHGGVADHWVRPRPCFANPPSLHFRLPPSLFVCSDSFVSLVFPSRIHRSRRNSICLFSDRCSRSASASNFCLRLAGMRKGKRTSSSLMRGQRLSTVWFSP